MAMEQMTIEIGKLYDLIEELDIRIDTVEGETR